jgi:hypothetical protein
MQHREWLWRSAFAVAGAAAYWLRFPPDWHSPYWLVYDGAALLVTGSSLGSIAGRLVGRDLRPGDLVRTIVLLLVLVLAWVFQEKGWLSPHVFCAWTVAVLEAGDAQNPPWLRGAVFAPSVIVVVVRALWPHLRMAPLNLYVVGALASATIVSGTGLLLIRWRSAWAKEAP